MHKVVDIDQPLPVSTSNFIAATLFSLTGMWDSNTDSARPPNAAATSLGRCVSRERILD